MKVRVMVDQVILDAQLLQGHERARFETALRSALQSALTDATRGRRPIRAYDAPVGFIDLPSGTRGASLGRALAKVVSTRLLPAPGITTPMPLVPLAASQPASEGSR